MPFTSTGEASEHQAWNPFSQSLGKAKVAGKEVGIPPMPALEYPVISERELRIEDLHVAMHEMIIRLAHMAYYADPMVKYVPIQLDPSVEYIVRMDGRWHFAIWLAAAANINIVLPGMMAAVYPGVIGWNVLPCPDGTKIYSGTAARLPATIRYANRGIAG